MTATSTSESLFDWSDLPVVHVRPSFLDNPLFTSLAARTIRKNDTIALPFGAGRTTSPASWRPSSAIRLPASGRSTS
ncbi:hypothetical protein PV342_38630 [Streptomyces sp. PA03-3a]|nr:hypothetical protein [Streptomyces sp. PA03-3a]